MKKSLFSFSSWVLIAAFAASSAPALAGLLDDDEARKAILELRSEVRKRDADHTEQLNRLGAASADNAARLRQEQAEQARQIDLLRRNVLELNNALSAAREDNAKLRGQLEVMGNSQTQAANAAQTQLQAQQKKQATFESEVDARLKKLEPRTVAVDGKEAVVDRSEETQFNAALNQFKATDYKAAVRAFDAFMVQFPSSGLQASAQFWLGNSQYAARDSKSALFTLQTMMQKFPQHPRAADAYLTMARCYDDLNDKKRGLELYNYIIAAFPGTPQAQAAAEALPKKPVPKKKA